MDKEEIKKELEQIRDRVNSLMCSEYRNYSAETDKHLTEVRDWLEEAIIEQDN